jgi:hypothetical protein
MSESAGYRAFISYSHLNRDVFGAVWAALQAVGLKQWSDQDLEAGTGFTEQTLAELKQLLEPLRTGKSPFEGRQPPKGTVFVQPKLVAEVEFGEWTRTGTVRHPSFKGLRDDKDPGDVILERNFSAEGQ